MDRPERLRPSAETARSAPFVRRARVHVHLDHGRSPSRWAERARLGEVHGSTAYGYEHAGDFLHLTFSADGPDGAVRRLLRGAQRRLVGADLGHAFRNRRALASADVVWTHTEYEWLAVALLRALRLIGRPLIVGQSVWFWDRARRFASLRDLLRRRFSQRIDQHTTLSEENARIAALRTRGRVAFVPFGIEPLSVPRPADSHPSSTRAVRVVAPGNDVDRDWDVLMEMARRRPGWSVSIVSERFVPPADCPANVHAFVARKAEDLLRAYASATCVVVPLRSNSHASGVTVALEAISAGVPVVVTDTGGIAAYVAGLADLVPPEDPTALLRAVESALAAPPVGYRASLERRGLTQRDYALRHVHLTAALLADAAVPDLVGRFEPVPSPAPVGVLAPRPARPGRGPFSRAAPHRR